MGFWFQRFRIHTRGTACQQAVCIVPGAGSRVVIPPSASNSRESEPDAALSGRSQRLFTSKPAPVTSFLHPARPHQPNLLKYDHHYGGHFSSHPLTHSFQQKTFNYCVIIIFKTGSHFVVYIGLKLTASLRCWDYSYEPLSLCMIKSFIERCSTNNNVKLCNFPNWM